MDALWIAVIVIICLALGTAAGWMLHARAGTDTALHARAAAGEATVAQLREQLAVQQAQLATAASSASADREAQRERERRDAAVVTALAPLQETLRTMQHSVASLERDRQAQYGSLAEQLRRAHESDEQLRDATHALAGALRSNSARGTWGETQLRRIVEVAGLTAHVDFDEQITLTDDDGRQRRPDMLVYLPGGKSIAVDAKAPLSAFLTAAGADESEQALAMRAHAKAVRAHVDALAKRAYWAAQDASPELVVCFLPSEAMLSAALEADHTLLDYAFDQRVALTSPVSLWAVLKSVAYTWTQQNVEAQAKELFRLGNQLYERLGTLAGHSNELRAAMEKAVNAYNRFAGSLETRVLVTARRFPGIDETKLESLQTPAPIETLPRHLTAPELLGPDHEADLGDVRDRLDAPRPTEVSSRPE